MLKTCRKFHLLTNRSQVSNLLVRANGLVSLTIENIMIIINGQSYCSASTSSRYTTNPRFVKSYHHRFYSSSTTTTAAATSSPYKIAIVGTGPSGFYTAKYLFSALEKQQQNHKCTIDLIERLPTPYGLVRYGYVKIYLQ